MTKRKPIKIGERDIDILVAIDRCPLTADQLFQLSETFCRPFTDKHGLRRRLRQLEFGSLLRSRPYSVCSTGRSPNYYKLTPKGYRQIYGLKSPLPKPRYFRSISHGHHHHTKSLSDFIVHVSRLAFRHGWSIENFQRENSVRFEAAGRPLLPDACFQIRTKDRLLNFVVELDNGTERVRSRQDVESIQRKIQRYDLHASQNRADADRYFVLFVTTRSSQRVNNIVSTAQEVMRNAQRSLFYTTNLDDFLITGDLLQDRVFIDNTGRHRSLVRPVGGKARKHRFLDASHRNDVITSNSCRKAVPHELPLTKV